MARGVTEQDVFAAADRLLARSERPTIERVRLEIGRGSPNTINPLLDLWWSELSKRQAGMATDSLPASLRLATNALYQEVLRQAETTARQSVTKLQEDVEAERFAVTRATEHLEAEKLGAQTLGNVLKSELAELRAANERLAQQVSDLTARLEVERSETVQAQLAARLADEARIRTSEAANAELTRVREQWQGNERHWLKEIENLRDELKRTRLDREGAQLAHRRQTDVMERELLGRSAELLAIQVQLQFANDRFADERLRRVTAETAEIETRRKVGSGLGSRRRLPLRRLR